MKDNMKGAVDGYIENGLGCLVCKSGIPLIKCEICEKYLCYDCAVKH